jgi:hypothetical protein
MTPVTLEVQTNTMKDKNISVHDRVPEIVTDGISRCVTGRGCVFRLCDGTIVQGS